MAPMKIKQFMPFYGNDFFEAVAGYPDSIAAGYLRAIWHYWSHTCCAGLPDDDEYLRRVCCCERQDWPGVKAIIFDDRYHFRLDGAVWHQPRCQKIRQKSQNVIDAREKAGRAAMTRRWGNASK